MGGRGYEAVGGVVENGEGCGCSAGGAESDVMLAEEMDSVVQVELVAFAVEIPDYGSGGSVGNDVLMHDNWGIAL